MFVIRLLPLFIAILYILLQNIDLRITIQDELTVKINFNIFAIVFKKSKKRRRKFAVSALRAIPSLMKASSFLLEKSIVKIRTLPGERAIFPKDSNNSLMINRLIYLILSNKAKNVFIENDLLTASKEFENNSKLIDISIYFSFLNLINSALIFVYYILKTNVKRLLRNV